jgi:multidrug transporter EmrE-like cation transporter
MNCDNMKKLLTNLLFAIVDLVCFLQGGVLLVYALLHFSYKVEVAHSEGLTTVEMQNIPMAIGGHYFYSEQYINIALIGIALIIVGILMRDWKKKFV